MNKFDRNLELINGLETEYLRVLYYDFNKYYKDTYKSYEYNRLCSIINGKKRVRINNSDYFTYDEKEFIILPPYSSVTLEIDIPTIALVLEISDTLINSIVKKVSFEFETDLSFNKTKNFSRNKNNSIINKTIKKILQTINSKDKNKEFLIDLYAQEMTYNLLKIKGLYDVMQVDSNNFIHLAIQMMKNNISNNITISEIAYSLNMSPANFSSKFKKITGLSPSEYLTNLKLMDSKRRLKAKNVTEVAYDLGYENISHFIKLFKQKFGITPKQYMLKQCELYHKK
jgi:AraC-like DNA-binding protein